MAAAEALFSQKHEHGGHVAEASEKSEGLELHTFNNMTRMTDVQERQKKEEKRRLDAMGSLSHARKTIINIRRDEALAPWATPVGISFKGVQAGPMVVTRLMDQGLAEEIENEVEQLMGRVMSETGGHLQRATAIDDHGRDAVDRALLEADAQGPLLPAAVMHRLHTERLQAGPQDRDSATSSIRTSRLNLRQASSSSLPSPRGGGARGLKQPQASTPMPQGQESDLQYDDPILCMVAAMVPGAGDRGGSLADDEQDEDDEDLSQPLTPPGMGNDRSSSCRMSSSGEAPAPALARTSLGGNSTSTGLPRSRPTLEPLSIPGSSAGSATTLQRFSSPQVLTPLVSPSPPGAHPPPVLGASAPGSPRTSLSGSKAAARHAAPLRSRLTGTTCERPTRSGAPSVASGPASRASSTAGARPDKVSQIDAAFQMVMAAVDRIRATDDGDDDEGTNLRSPTAATSKASPPAQDTSSTVFSGQSVFARPVDRSPVQVASPGFKRKLGPGSSTSMSGAAGGEDQPLPNRMSFPGTLSQPAAAAPLSSSPKYSERSSFNGKAGMLPQGKAQCLSPLAAVPSLPPVTSRTAVGAEGTPIGALPLSELLSRISLRERKGNQRSG